MTNEVTSANQAGVEKKSDAEEITELSEDMEMVSPGAMLREAREAQSLSQDYIAGKLNFKVALVNNIEKDSFDPSMPVTFNRGYLANYAKLVGVDVDDVLASYDALDAASIQRSEMLSFSKETSKQAEHSRVMWLSYLIVAVLIGLTVLWWQQESSQQADNSTSDLSSSADIVSEQNSDELLNVTDTSVAIEALEAPNATDLVASDTVDSVSVITSEEPVDLITSEKTQPQEPEISTAVFTFNGDCWVNIYDATGERIAWGVKKSGYVMTIQGKAPLRITVGKPELTSIIFNGKPVDMSAFNLGNIAKFNLPILVD